MSDEEIQQKVLELSIERWNRFFGGTSALDICDKILFSNELVMKAMEALCFKGSGTINANVELYPIIVDLNNPEFEIPSEPTVTHVFFPSRDLLSEHFYSSTLVREKFPEYKNRLHCGARQLELVMFSDEVLTRYFSHPEFYEIDDSLSGGDIYAKSEAPENRYLYIRYGKRKLENGRTAVTAILKDLYVMSAEEQRYWHAYELLEESFDKNDPNFARFIARTYDGAFVEYSNPLKDVVETIKRINNTFGAFGLLFKQINNAHFRVPVENTRKAYCDCSSEFYKLIGTDTLNQKTIKKMLSDVFSVGKAELIHSESKRPLSALQLLGLLEEKMTAPGLLSNVINKIGAERVKADHKVIEPSVEEINFVDNFIGLCKEFIEAGIEFERRVNQF